MHKKYRYHCKKQSKYYYYSDLFFMLCLMKVVILENIRSAYNVGNIIRTADALGWQVRLT